MVVSMGYGGDCQLPLGCRTLRFRYFAKSFACKIEQENILVGTMGMGILCGLWLTIQEKLPSILRADIHASYCAHTKSRVNIEICHFVLVLLVRLVRRFSSG